MNQLLKPPKRAQKAAHKPPQQYPQQNQRACYIIGKLEFGRADYRLHRPDGARACCGRAGVAVEPRHADSLALSPVNLPLKQIGQVRICQQHGAGLRKSPKPGEKAGNGRSL